MKKKILKGLFIFLIGFMVLFTIRLIYGYIKYPNGVETSVSHHRYQVNQDFRLNVKNYASFKYKKKGMATSGIETYSVDQKYEKIANMKSHSNEIEASEKKVRGLIKDQNSIIQYEQKSGVKKLKNRILNLAIGVPPEKFDNLVNKLKDIGSLISINIDKKDKTNEYKKLKAKKSSLMAIRTSLIALKEKGGKIDEFINLENRILEIEKEIQDLGINLGEFDAENEFCTVKFSLIEKSKAKKREIPILHRVSVALGWALQYYTVFIVILFMMSLIVLMLTTIMNHLKWVRTLIEKRFE